jgi:light-regulated signal transduction histidine kinase (bacteriophytochrome)
MIPSEGMATSGAVDPANCDREQIQYSGAIQPHGALLAVGEPELRILQASRNTGHLLGIAAEKLVGGNLRLLLSDEQIGKMLRLLAGKPDAPPLHVARMRIAGREFDVVAHRCDGLLIVELESIPERAAVSVLELYCEVQATAATLEATTGLQPFLDLTARCVRSFTGFDRVMIYKFMEDDSGWVRAEALGEGLEPYLGLHYPPFDIPAPARRLFSLTWVRLQPDLACVPVPIYPETNPVTGRPLDMSYALLRSVSVMYVDYLKNMGTRASLVLTLLKDGKLWGLIKCHHHSGPKYVPFEARLACELLARMISLLIGAKEDLENHEYRAKLASTRIRMVEDISGRADFSSGFFSDPRRLLDFVRADGAAAVVNGEVMAVGLTPSKTEIAQLVKWLATATPQFVFTTDCLSRHFPEAAAFKDACCGLLALRFFATKDDFLLWFRQEILQTANWAGNLHKPVEISSDGQRLLPRTSFALWEESVRMTASPWSAAEREAAQQLRADLLELVLHRSNDLGRLYTDLERSHAELDSFAYIASHDLKEPLRGINNLAEMLREDYADKLDTAGVARLATLGRLGAHMGELLDALLEYSQVKRSEFSGAEVDMNRVLRDAVEILHLRIEAGAVAILIPRPLPPARGDRMRLVEVFTNLISNAIKYNDKKAKEVEIGFEEPHAGGQPVFYVRDNGIGIQEKHFELIFQIFRRLHGRDEFGGGSGAGLTIAGKIIERAGGRIWLKSIPGQGSTFYFTLGRDAPNGEKT